MLNKLKFIFISILLFYFGKIVLAQDCPRSQVIETLSGNNIKASIPINGNLFWTESSDNQFAFINTNSLPPFPTTFFTTGIWIGAKNNANELKLAAATYQTEFGKDFFSGPIHNNNSQLSFQCEDFDRIWQVFGHEILQHLSDFANDGIIDQPIQNIYAYPAHQNPYFEIIHGFSLPNTPQGLAPFSDQNNDGIYNPDDGDFPLPENVAPNKIPKQIIWGIFNDGAGPHTQSQGEPLNIEVQLTAYSFYCNENELLNNTIFTSHKIINRGNETLDSLIFTKFVDFDLGCYTDDYIGSIPDLNTFYAYNQDAVDGTTGAVCNGGVATFGTNPPVQAITLLNQEMSSLSMSYTNFLGAPIPTEPPNTPNEFHNLMKGLWPDGEPITAGEEGYNTGGQITPYLFPDNPNNPDGWSMFTENLPFGDRRCMANIEFDNQFQTNDFVKIDLAYTFYQDAFLNNVETVDLVYDRTPELQQLYDNNFVGCDFTICPNDCVWTGDANRDSIVTAFDILQIGLAHGQMGSERDKPLIWQPFNSDDWGQNLLGVDLKHADCNGSGTIGDTDFDWVDLNFGNSYKLGTTVDEYPQGSEISIVTNQLGQYQYGTLGKATINLNQAEDIYGLAFTLEFDPTYLGVLFGFKLSIWDSQISNTFSFSKINNETGTIDYAFVKKDGINSTSIIDEIAEVRFFTQTQNFELVQTYLRIKNIRAILSNGVFLDYGAQDFLVNIINTNGDGQILSTENLEETNIQVFPNPTSDILNIKMENPSLTNFSIFDIYGKKVLEKTEVNQNEIQLSTSIFSPGVYFLRIEIEGKELVKKIIKM
ncbi:MAG: T9SS type A sorting domain-containing protein [Saprospiraceae bacterium]